MPMLVMNDDLGRRAVHQLGAIIGGRRRAGRRRLARVATKLVPAREGRTTLITPMVRQCAAGLTSRLATSFEATNPEAPATLHLQTSFVDSRAQVLTLAKR